MTKNNWLVADICDQFPDNFSVLPQVFKPYGKIKKCQGKIETILLEEDNRKLIELLGQEGSERIVVVQCQRKDSAVFGDRLAKIAIDHNWGGVIVDGAIRDISTLRDMPICVFASAVYPIRGKQNGGGEIGVTLKVGAVALKPNDYIYADEDGIIISTKELF
jgi:regulator of ribonuclease activity A